jgi:hypothetical protein
LTILIVKEQIPQKLIRNLKENISSKHFSLDTFTCSKTDKTSGGAREDRTPDLLRARQALSQLSYGPLIPDDIYVINMK